VLSQFRRSGEGPTLADYIDERSLRLAGRLDKDSEGLVVLTDAGWLLHRIAHPRFKLAKTYWVQLEGVPDQASLEALRSGVELRDGPTRPAHVRPMEEPPGLWSRDPPIRYRRTVATSWLEVTLFEGRNRQVRRMTAAVGLPTLRLIRHAIGPWQLSGLQPGQSRTAPLAPEG
jgi:23S rRNA pseudouridine2457 synthase